MAVNTVAAGDPVASEDHNVLAGLFNGTTGYGQPAKFYELNDATAYSVIAGNQDTTNGYAFKAQYGALSGSPTVLATMAKAGIALLTSASVGGQWIDSNGRVGFLDSATEADLSANNTPFAVTRTSAVNEVMADFQLRNSYTGAQVTTGTASAGAGTTLTVAGTPWTVNAYAGKIVHLLTGTGASVADPYRYISSNTNNTLTVALAWTTNPGAGTTFEIVTPGDAGTMRTLFESKATRVGAGRAAEFHGFGQTGSADSGLMGLEVSFGSNVAQFSTINNVGINLRASAAWLTSNIGTTQGGHLYMWGELLTDFFMRAEDTSGHVVFKTGPTGLTNIGYNSAGLGTALLSLNQTGVASTDGLRVYKQNSAAKYGAFWMDTNDTLNILALQSGGQTTLLIASNAGNDALTVSGDNALTGNLQVWSINGVGTKASVRADGVGNFTVKGVATLAKAGVPSDADWSSAPPVGTLVVDTTNSRIYARTAAATWKQVGIT